MSATVEIKSKEVPGHKEVAPFEELISGMISLKIKSAEVKEHNPSVTITLYVPSFVANNN